jgi:SRSO17 transposase
MQGFVGKADWDDANVLQLGRTNVLDAIERHGIVAGWIIDATGIRKKRQRCVGVSLGYCGLLGKQGSCQVAGGVTLANEALSVPSGYRLYLPESWADDKRRRIAAGVRKGIEFQTKWQITLDMIDGF